MSDRMHPIPFARMLDWTLREWQENGSVFGCHKVYRAAPGRRFAFAGHRVETPIGPAAGPHTQLAQNIAAAYLCGGRIMELKTVQQLDGEDLHVSKPCILAEDEGYNCVWTTPPTRGWRSPAAPRRCCSGAGWPPGMAGSQRKRREISSPGRQETIPKNFSYHLLIFLKTGV